MKKVVKCSRRNTYFFEELSAQAKLRALNSKVVKYFVKTQVMEDKIKEDIDSLEHVLESMECEIFDFDYDVESGKVFVTAKMNEDYANFTFTFNGLDDDFHLWVPMPESDGTYIGDKFVLLWGRNIRKTQQAADQFNGNVEELSRLDPDLETVIRNGRETVEVALLENKLQRIKENFLWCLTKTTNQIADAIVEEFERTHNIDKYIEDLLIQNCMRFDAEGNIVD